MRASDAPAPADAGTAVRGRRRALTSAEAAWLAVLPCALATLLAIVVLGPPLGARLPAGSVTPWPSFAKEFLPEPTEHARYALALLAPVLLAAAVAWAARRTPRTAPQAARAAIAVQSAGLAFVVVCLLAQRAARFGERYESILGASPTTVYFTPATLLAACAIGVALAAAVHSRRATAAAGALLRETRPRRLAGWLLAAAASAMSLLPAINSEATILMANENTWYHLTFTFDEAVAVLDGRSPLVDFAAQYGSLWPYALAGAMSVLGTSVEVFTLVAALLTAAATLAVFAVLRRVTASTLAALALFGPLLATSFFMMNGSLANRFSLATVTGVYPLRLAGPCLLLWLTARHLDGARPRGRWLLFLAAGLVVLNNVDFGLPALGATLAAIVWAEPPSPRARGVARLALELALGLAAAYAAVAVLTLAHAGSLPHLGLLVRYASLFAGSGFGMLPILPALGVSTLIFLTYVAAIGAATVRAVDRDPDRLLTGLLAWAGTFGCGVGAYYVGRSHPEVLTNMFPAWALALVLLLVASLRAIARRPSRLPSPAELACLIAFGVLVCSLAQLPAPWTQVERLRTTTGERLMTPAMVRFVREHTHPGERVALLSTLGHRFALAAGVTDVTPYTGSESMPTQEQFAEMLDVLRAEGGHTIFGQQDEAIPEAEAALRAAGFHLIGVAPDSGLTAFSDAGR